MSNLVIVAIPASDDDVWQVSSERKPHMTICFLGPAEANPNVSKITDYVKEQSNRLVPFNLLVDHRGVLGSDEADVLFFSDEIPWSVVDFRESLLSDVNIRAAYNSMPQHTKWSPHLTLGYPDTPANKDSWDPNTPVYVKFDKVAVWFSDFGGIEIPLTDKTPKLSMVDSPAEWAGTKVGEILSHHGVKGQRWGVKRDKTPSAPSVTQKGKKLKGSGGSNQPAHPEAVKARAIGQQGKASGLHSLSNKDLEAYARRLDLEQRVQRLQENDRSGPNKFIRKLLKANGNQKIDNEKDSKRVKAGKVAIKLAATAA